MPLSIEGPEPNPAMGKAHPLLDDLVEVADSNKVHEIIMKVIGFLAALIMMGTYIQLPPGGSMPSWAGCIYPLFTTYVALNGIALVFSMVAMIAVIFGPYALVRMHRVEWRRQVVQVGLYHIWVSLGALLAAFACAGLIRAGVSAPDPRCARLQCLEGGVPCSPYSVRYTSNAGAPANTRSLAANLNSLADIELLLESTLVVLNRQLFANNSGAERQFDVVVCHNYGLVDNTSLDCNNSDTQVDNRAGFPTSRTCFPLLSDTAFHTSFNKLSGQGAVDTRTLWCSSDRTSLGPGWLPLTYAKTFALLKSSRHATQGGAGEQHSAGNTICPGPLATSGCDDVRISQGVSLHVHRLLPGDSYPSSQLINLRSGQLISPYDDAFTQYVGILGGPQALQLFCEQRDQFNGSLCDGDGMFSLSDPPLRSAVPYEALRFRCTRVSNDTQPSVLCDHGVDPPLAVDANGRYINRLGVQSQGGFVLFGSQPRDASVLGAVVIFLGLLFVALTWSAWCLKYDILQNSEERCMQRMRGLLDVIARMKYWVLKPRLVGQPLSAQAQA